MGLLDHIWLGIVTVFSADPVFSIAGLPISITIVMVILGFLFGIFVGATPGIGGPFAMAKDDGPVKDIHMIGHGCYMPREQSLAKQGSGTKINRIQK